MSAVELVESILEIFESNPLTNLWAYNSANDSWFKLGYNESTWYLVGNPRAKGPCNIFNIAELEDDDIGALELVSDPETP